MDSSDKKTNRAAQRAVAPARWPLIAALLLLLTPAACGDEEVGYLRVINLSSTTPAVDVGFDGERRVIGLATGASSGHIVTSTGTLAVRAVASEGSRVLLQQTIEMAANEHRTLFLFDATDKQLISEAEETPPEATGTHGVVELDDRGGTGAKLRFVHAVSDGRIFDLDTAKAGLFSTTSFQSVSSYLTLSEAKPALTVKQSAGQNDVLIALKQLELKEGSSYTMVIQGTDPEEDGAPIIVRLFEDTRDDDPGLDPELQDARLMVFHGSPGADKIFAEVDTSQITSSSLAYLQSSSYAAIKAGSHVITLKVSTGGATFYETTRFFKAASSYTIAVADVPKKITALLFEDRLPTLGTAKAGLRVIHLSPDAPTLDVKVKGDVASLFFGLRFKDSSAFAPLPAGSHDLEVNDAQSGSLLLAVPSLVLKDGVAHTIFLRGNRSDKTFGYTLTTVTP